MWVELLEDGLLIVTETNFEEQYIAKQMDKDKDIFVKTGITLTDVIGLKIKFN